MKGAAVMSKKFSMKDVLNKESIAQAAPAAAPSGFVIHDIPLDKIVTTKANHYGIRDIEELAASIEQLGLLHNLVVKPPDDSGHYELVSGERRYTALKLLEWPTAPCRVEGHGDSLEDELRLLHANATGLLVNKYLRLRNTKSRHGIELPVLILVYCGYSDVGVCFHGLSPFKNLTSCSVSNLLPSR